MSKFTERSEVHFIVFRRKTIRHMRSMCSLPQELACKLRPKAGFTAGIYIYITYPWKGLIMLLSSTTEVSTWKCREKYSFLRIIVRKIPLAFVFKEIRIKVLFTKIFDLVLDFRRELLKTFVYPINFFIDKIFEKS